VKLVFGLRRFGQPKSGSCGGAKRGSAFGSTGCENNGYHQRGELRRGWKLPAPNLHLAGWG
jgi:hypothetical protein